MMKKNFIDRTAYLHRPEKSRERYTLSYAFSLNNLRIS
jgi:hypothetical protein